MDYLSSHLVFYCSSPRLSPGVLSMMQHTNALPCSEQEKALWMQSRFNPVLGLALTFYPKLQQMEVKHHPDSSLGRGQSCVWGAALSQRVMLSPTWFMTPLPPSALSAPTTHLCSSPSLSENPLATHGLNLLCKELLLALRGKVRHLTSDWSLKTPLSSRQNCKFWLVGGFKN